MHTTSIRSRLLFALAVLVASPALGGCLADRTVNTNVIPKANAGKDQQLDYDGKKVAVHLDGSKSSDQDGRIVEYLWRSADDGEDGGAPSSDLDPPDVERPTLELGQGSYTFTLWVRDDKGAVSAPDNVTVRVGVDPVVECKNSLPAAFPSTCGACVCGVNDACRAAVKGCDATCFALIGCIAMNCPDTSDIACITGKCADSLGGANGAMAFTPPGCFTTCMNECKSGGQ